MSQPLSILEKVVICRLRERGLTELAELARQAWNSRQRVMLLTSIADYELQCDFDAANLMYGGDKPMDVSQADLVDWRATVRKQAKNCDAIAEMINELDGELGSRHEFEQQAAELRRLGDWLDTLTGVSMGKPVNGHKRVSA